MKHSVALVLLFASLLTLGPAAAQDIKFLRIGTGPTGGTYFPVGGLIATALSNPPGSRPCEKGGNCGIPGVIAVAQSTDGSVANVEALAAKKLDAALVQADVAYWAFHGTSIFRNRAKGSIETLRAVAMLYPENLHLVVRRSAGIKSVQGLRGRRVSLGAAGSGTPVEAEIVLRAYDLTPNDVTAFHLSLGVAADRMAAGKLDAFFEVDGAPEPAIAALAEKVEIDLIPITGWRADGLKAAYPFFQDTVIAAGTYHGVGEVKTLGVGATLLVTESLPEDLAYALTKALWHENNRPLFRSGHPRARLMKRDNAIKGLGVDLHPGAKRYYVEKGLID